jgi:hypothetical protein
MSERVVCVLGLGRVVEVPSRFVVLLRGRANDVEQRRMSYAALVSFQLAREASDLVLLDSTASGDALSRGWVISRSVETLRWAGHCADAP